MKFQLKDSSEVELTGIQYIRKGSTEPIECNKIIYIPKGQDPIVVYEKSNDRIKAIIVE